MTSPSTLFGGFLGFLSHRATPSHPPNFIDSDSFSTNQPFFGGTGPNQRHQEFKGTAKEILGTCFAVGCTVDGQKPGALQQAASHEKMGYDVICFGGVVYPLFMIVYDYLSIVHHC